MQIKIKRVTHVATRSACIAPGFSSSTRSMESMCDASVDRYFLHVKGERSGGLVTFGNVVDSRMNLEYISKKVKNALKKRTAAPTRATSGRGIMLTVLPS